MSRTSGTSEALLPAPEPSLSANVYCAGRLDEVIYRGVAPFWQEERAATPERIYLRLLRYVRGGDHLKIRIHAPESLVARLRPSLEAAIRPCLDALAPAAPGEGRPVAQVPPIDVEDETEGGHPDRSFVWTQYRRSYVEFGGKPLIDDDDYIAHVVACQAECSERTLAALKPDATGVVPFRVRQNTLIKAALSAVAAMPWSAEQRRGYFAYHRDWLMRYSFSQSNRGPDKAAEAVAKLEANIARLGAGLEAYRKAAEAQWGEAAPPGDETDAAFREALQALCRFVAPFAGKPELQVDPFAAEPMFSALFKVLHALGNQLGLKLADESFAHHLLLRIAGAEAGHAFTHDPPSP